MQAAYLLRMLAGKDAGRNLVKYSIRKSFFDVIADEVTMYPMSVADTKQVKALEALEVWLDYK